MNEEDKKRLHRKVKLSLYDLERIRGAIRDQMTFYFKAGVDDQYEYLKGLDKMLKEAIEKERAG